MANDVDQVRWALNGLIETCKESNQGFRGSAEKLIDLEIRTLFLNYSRQRAHFAGELHAEVARLGGEAVAAGSSAGTMRRGWTGLKNALSADTDQAILEEAERAEDIAVKNYREALNTDLPERLHGIVSRQYHEIQQAHIRVRELRNRDRFESSAPMAGLV